MLIESVRSEENEIGDPGALPKRARRTTCSGQAGRPGNGRVSERGRRSGDGRLEKAAAAAGNCTRAGTRHQRPAQGSRSADHVIDGHVAPSPGLPALPPGLYSMDLYGNADRFMHLFGRDVRWCEAQHKWLFWDARCWRPDDVRRVNWMAEQTMHALASEGTRDERAEAWAAKCRKDGKVAREMLEVIKHRSTVRVEDLDRDGWLMGAANGVIDLRTGELLPHDRDQLITKLSPASYDPQAACPRWEEFMAEIMGGDAEMIEALQRLAGYCLTGDVSVQVLPILCGRGANGKSVFVDTLVGILGPFAAEAPESLVTAQTRDEHPTEVADLHGKRLIVASETEKGRKLRIGMVKKMTGNKFLKGRFMRRDFFQFERTHKTILVTNNKPVIPESTHAVWRRLRLIPFEVVIPEDKQDLHLTEKLQAEWPGILAWAVRGCLDWQARKFDMGFPQAVLRATENYRGDCDRVAAFLSDRCVDRREDPERKARTPKEQVYATYFNWCGAAGEEALGREDFNGQMRGHGFADKTAKLEGKAQKCWMDLNLKE